MIESAIIFDLETRAGEDLSKTFGPYLLGGEHYNEVIDDAYKNVFVHANSPELLLNMMKKHHELFEKNLSLRYLAATFIAAKESDHPLLAAHLYQLLAAAEEKNIAVEIRTKAFELLLKSKHNSPNSYYLGLCYLKGHYVYADPEAAKELFVQSTFNASASFRRAQYHLNHKHDVVNARILFAECIQEAEDDTTVFYRDDDFDSKESLAAAARTELLQLSVTDLDAHDWPDQFVLRGLTNRDQLILCNVDGVAAYTQHFLQLGEEYLTRPDATIDPVEKQQFVLFLKDQGDEALHARDYNSAFEIYTRAIAVGDLAYHEKLYQICIEAPDLKVLHTKPELKRFHLVQAINYAVEKGEEKTALSLLQEFRRNPDFYPVSNEDFEPAQLAATERLTQLLDAAINKNDGLDGLEFRRALQQYKLLAPEIRVDYLKIIENRLLDAARNMQIGLEKVIWEIIDPIFTGTSSTRWVDDKQLTEWHCDELSGLLAAYFDVIKHQGKDSHAWQKRREISKFVNAPIRALCEIKNCLSHTNFTHLSPIWGEKVIIETYLSVCPPDIRNEIEEILRKAYPLQIEGHANHYCMGDHYEFLSQVALSALTIKVKCVRDEEAKNTPLYNFRFISAYLARPQHKAPLKHRRIKQHRRSFFESKDAVRVIDWHFTKLLDKPMKEAEYQHEMTLLETLFETAPPECKTLLTNFRSLFQQKYQATTLPPEKIVASASASINVAVPSAPVKYPGLYDVDPSRASTSQDVVLSNALPSRGSSGTIMTGFREGEGAATYTSVPSRPEEPATLPVVHPPIVAAVATLSDALPASGGPNDNLVRTWPTVPRGSPPPEYVPRNGTSTVAEEGRTAEQAM